MSSTSIDSWTGLFPTINTRISPVIHSYSLRSCSWHLKDRPMLMVYVSVCPVVPRWSRIILLTSDKRPVESRENSDDIRDRLGNNRFLEWIRVSVTSGAAWSGIQRLLENDNVGILYLRSLIRRSAAVRTGKGSWSNRWKTWNLLVWPLLAQHSRWRKSCP